MQEMRRQYPVSLMSRVLEVSASGYYAWLERSPSDRTQKNARLEVEIKAAPTRTRQTCGPEPLQHDLAEHGASMPAFAESNASAKSLGCAVNRRRNSQ